MQRDRAASELELQIIKSLQSSHDFLRTNVEIKKIFDNSRKALVGTITYQRYLLEFLLIHFTCDCDICLTLVDSILQIGEQCDDGNPFSGDGCSYSNCTLETGYTCPVAGTACIAVCGDG